LVRILLNGESLATEARNLGELCASLGFAEAKVATALNGSFVPAAKRGSTELAPQDQVEIVAPRQGG
jgi:sulfur carrier protein